MKTSAISSSGSLVGSSPVNCGDISQYRLAFQQAELQRLDAQFHRARLDAQRQFSQREIASMFDVPAYITRNTNDRFLGHSTN